MFQLALQQSKLACPALNAVILIPGKRDSDHTMPTDCLQWTILAATGELPFDPGSQPIHPCASPVLQAGRILVPGFS
jgi:hypothetical protein